MTLSPEECAPGDLVRLSFELESETFTEMTIGYRSPEGIHPVVTEKRPIEFNSQTQCYEQKEYWILQAMHSGEFLFSDLMVTLDGLADIKQIKINHYDLFRLKNKEEIKNLDLFNDISNTITFIEWPQIIDKKPDNLIELNFKYEENHQKRSVQIKGLSF